MSAYSASPPVTASTTAPSTAKPIQPLLAKKWKPWIGLSAPSTAGSRVMPATPSTAIATNQTTMIGPKRRPTLSVPYFWITKMPTMIVSDSGSTYGSKSGVATVRPSIAPSTVMAGVIMPSP